VSDVARRRSRPLNRLLDRATSALERAAALDPAADAVGAVAARIPAGAAKDVLSGVPIGHPAHPMLVTVPIGAVTSALVLDVMGDESRAARRLLGLGILAAVPTAITGLSDWSDTTGAERRVGLVHMTLNTAALGLLGASWVARGRPGMDGGRWLSAAGFGILGVSGWLGGHLAYAMGVGVDTTAFLRPPTTWTDAAAEGDLVEDQPVEVTVD
jgi:uncharacterized membrane protein